MATERQELEHEIGRSLATQLLAERDQLRQRLLSVARDHRAERAHGRTANLEWADSLLDDVADQVRKELGDG